MAAVQTPLSRILKSDLDAIGDLLTRGFQHRSRGYWMRAAAAAGRATLRLPDREPRRASGLPVDDLFEQGHRQ